MGHNRAIIKSKPLSWSLISSISKYSFAGTNCYVVAGSAASTEPEFRCWAWSAAHPKDFVFSDLIRCMIQLRAEQKQALAHVGTTFSLLLPPVTPPSSGSLLSGNTQTKNCRCMRRAFRAVGAVPVFSRKQDLRQRKARPGLKQWFFFFFSSPCLCVLWQMKC